jgi:NAD(P)-dependent dehydrogenase (short-subunit alcohol dehydrogenase family)
MHGVIVGVLKRSYAGFSNAGAAQLESTSETPFDEMKHINFRGAYFTVQKALPLLSDGGAIISQRNCA